MAAKPLNKTKIVSHMAEKVGTSKKTAVQFFEELFKLAVKEAKGAAGKFVIPNIGRGLKAHGKPPLGGIPQIQAFLPAAPVRTQVRIVPESQCQPINSYSSRVPPIFLVN